MSVAIACANWLRQPRREQASRNRLASTLKPSSLVGNWFVPRSLHGEIRDYGAGFGLAQPFLPSRMFASSKPDGLGVGLVLSHATVERLNGELSVQKTDGPGVRVCFELPLANGMRP